MKRICSVLLLLALLLSLLVVPAQAEELGYVTDAAGLLTAGEWETLENLCADISNRFACGVYIVTVDDFTAYGSGDVFEVTYGIYHDYNLGKGAARDGVILLLSMADRDFALFVYGDGAEYALDGYGQQMLEDAFLPPLGENDWYGGFTAYAETCGEYLALAADGTPVREEPPNLIPLLIGLSFLVSLVVVSILKIGMKNVKKQALAGQYQTGRLNLRSRHDLYTHTTQTRVKVQSSSGGSSVSRSGGGGSGRSGKF